VRCCCFGDDEPVNNSDRRNGSKHREQPRRELKTPGKTPDKTCNSLCRARES
jgi:hypothetical protein